jgi:hypothetical protein
MWIYRGGNKYKYKFLVGKTEAKKLSGRPSHRWNINIKRDPKCKLEVCGMDASTEE